ncbi:MAG: alpha/beta hydrolase [Bacteroidia bacterium]|nr:alpha/beta hydrolase [Bacteroidia bacterium]MBP7714999.1 alpha/beta hydrolase [Bacteroidia bacterium]MBP8668044.1 alpha/beta hydrolase [Bacteroidia bacterium]HOZ81663.1 alpha/beta hydrolase [Bacteroidia bacterium]HRB39755.1 alpha/beta hydrolase [Bacteroidia bacterium]
MITRKQPVTMMYSKALIKPDGEVLNYSDTSSGNEVLVLIHGYPFDQSIWKEQVIALSDQARIITYDVRGYGSSSKGKERFSIDLFADDLIFLLDSLQVSKFIVCGLSMGGYIALNLVKRYPERIKGLVLYDTQCYADNAIGKAKRYENIELIRKGGKQKYLEDMCKILFSPATFQKNDVVIKQTLDLMMKADNEVLMQTLEAMAEREESCSNLSSIKFPTMILCGEYDVLTPPEKSEFMQQQIPGSVLHIIENSGHLGHLENKDAFNQHLNSFLKSF